MCRWRGRSTVADMAAMIRAMKKGSDGGEGDQVSHSGAEEWCKEDSLI